MIENFTNLLGCQAVWCCKDGRKNKELCTVETAFLLMALRLLLGPNGQRHQAPGRPAVTAPANAQGILCAVA